MFTFISMTADDLFRAIDVDSDTRSRGCTPNLVRFDDKKGILDFVTRCSGSANSWQQRVALSDYNIILDLLEEEEPEEVEEEEVEEELEEPEEEVIEEVPEKVEEEEVEEEETKEASVNVPTIRRSRLLGRSQTVRPYGQKHDSTGLNKNINKRSFVKRYGLDWNQIKTDIPEVLESDIKVHCSCPAYLYWGSKYTLTELDSAIELETRFPSRNDPLLSKTLCKHLIAVLRKYFI